MESTNPQPLRWGWSGCISGTQCSHWAASNQLRKCGQHSKRVVGVGRRQPAVSFANRRPWLAGDRQFLWSGPRADSRCRGPLRISDVVSMCKTLVMVCYGIRDYR